MRTYPPLLAAALLLGACAGQGESTDLRPRSVLTPQQLETTAREATDQLRDTQPLLRERETNSYVRCVADALIRALPGDPGNWRVTVFIDNSPNAFALPGGDIGLTAGLLRVLDNQDRLAAVIAHMIAHQQAGDISARAAEHPLPLGTPVSRETLGVLGVGPSLGTLQPFDAAQEATADQTALQLMGRAGFNPAAAEHAWKALQAERALAAAGNGTTPEILTMHPADHGRLSALASVPTQAIQDFDNRRLRNQRPECGGREPGEYTF